MMEPGERLEQWEIIAALGEGGMGSVFRARHALSPDIEAALKVLKPQLASGEGRERFLREIRALHALRHPAIVRIMGFGEDAGRGLLWMAMELVPGADLAHHATHGAMPPDVAQDLFIRLAEGLAHAHARGIYHRDIKPANIIYDAASGDGMLVDFGIAIDDASTRLTATGLVAGTPAYMAPEIFASEPVEPGALDVYALGQCLCEALSGQQAFADKSGASGQQRLMRLMNAKLQRECLDPGDSVSDALRAVIRAATQANPEDRIPSAQALADRLRAIKASSATVFPAVDVGAQHPPNRVTVPEAAPEPGATVGMPAPAPRPRPRPQPSEQTRSGPGWLVGLGVGGLIAVILGVGGLAVLIVVAIASGMFGETDQTPEPDVVTTSEDPPEAVPEAIPDETPEKGAESMPEAVAPVAAGPAAVPDALLGRCIVSTDQILDRDCVGCANIFYDDGQTIEQYLVAFFALRPEEPSAAELAEAMLRPESIQAIWEGRQLAATSPDDPNIVAARQIYESIVQGIEINIGQSTYSLKGMGMANNAAFVVEDAQPDAVVVQFTEMNGAPTQLRMSFTRQESGVIIIQNLDVKEMTWHCAP